MHKNWLERSLKSASEEVAKWPAWKKRAFRVLPKKDNMAKTQDYEQVLEQLIKVNNTVSHLINEALSGEERDHIKQAHFRLVEAIVHLRLSKKSLTEY